MSCRAIVEVDCEDAEGQGVTISNGANVRTGTVPVSYDPERKKMLWYYFLAAAMKADQVVSALPHPASHPFHQPTLSCYQQSSTRAHAALP